MIGTIGQCLKDKRLELGVSAKQAAEMIGCGLGSIYNWETGISAVSAKYIDSVMDFIGDGAIIVADPHQDIAETSKPENAGAALKSETKIEKVEPDSLIYEYEVITNNRERIKVKAECVKFDGDKDWICFSTRSRLVATFRPSEILGVKEILR